MIKPIVARSTGRTINWQAVAVLGLTALLSGCNSSKPTANIGSHSIAVTMLQQVNSQAHKCWLKDSDFNAYGIVPELDTTGTPRLLIIPRGKPQALPNLVIAATGSNISLYGPLTSSELAPRINNDVSRWSKGGSGCA